MTRPSLIIRGRRVTTPDGTRGAAIHVTDGRIVAVAAFDEVPQGVGVVEAGDSVIFPGLVDTHVHVNEPGRTEWEGFETATRAAAAGGVTTILDMPLNSIPATTSVAALETKRAAAEGHCMVDTGFLGGFVGDNIDDLSPLHRAGVFAFKCFLCPSGVDEFPAVTPANLRRAAPIFAGLDALLMVHAELPAVLERAAVRGDPRSYRTWLMTRPAEAETAAVELLIEVARESGMRVHVVHVSSPETVERIQAAKSTGVRITAETCPHYLGFAAEEIPDGATEFKCAPPIRDRRSREGLWEAVAEGRLDAVVSDHSPVPPSLKLQAEGDFLRAWGGIASLQLRLPAVWTGAAARGLALEQMAELLCAGPARLAGLEGCKGAISPGCDADLVLWNPEEEFVVQETTLAHRHGLTPWLGRRLKGTVQATFVRGERAEPSRGRLLSRVNS